MSRKASPRRSHGLAARLLAGQSIVLIAGGLTVGLVAALVGPPIFHDHLLQSGHAANSPEIDHIEMAYRDASLIALGVGLVISLLAAIAVTWYSTRSLRGPLDDVTRAARELSSGNYASRIPPVGSGTELETLADAFNTMADKLAGIEDTRRRMLSDLAHELRTPIATLSAYHEGLHDGVAVLGPESRAALSEQTRRLARLADDIDVVSTAEEGRLDLDRESYPVAVLLAAAYEGMRDAYAARAVHFVVDGSAAAGAVLSVDRNRIGQVLANLLGNALRHTPAGGTVTMAAHRVGADVRITITDDGEGMTAEQIEHAFERFYRGDTARSRDRDGSGIGLTISRAIVEAHGGSIAATSAGRGQGAVLTVTLPAHI